MNGGTGFVRLEEARRLMPTRIESDIRAERARQDAKWGADRVQPHTVWTTILTEEVGESAQEALRVEYGGAATSNLRAELVQVAAVAVAWIEAIDRFGIPEVSE